MLLEMSIRGSWSREVVELLRMNILNLVVKVSFRVVKLSFRVVKVSFRVVKLSFRVVKLSFGVGKVMILTVLISFL